MAVEISSGKQRLLCISDLVLHPIHLEMPGWLAAVDVVANQVVKTRNKLLKRIACARTKVMAFHFSQVMEAQDSGVIIHQVYLEIEAILN